jgi:hypothetical protein
VTRTFSLAFTAAVCLTTVLTLRAHAEPPPRKSASRAHVHTTAPQPLCNGTFSDGSVIDPTHPTYLNDVPPQQTFCDFHTFAWNQFIYLTQMAEDSHNRDARSARSSQPAPTPLFMHLAPWYNALKADELPPPAAYPGGDTSLSCAHLSMDQAGDDDHLVDVAHNTVLYDIRFNQPMYDHIVGQPGGSNGVYTQRQFLSACAPDPTTGNCTKTLLLPPLTSQDTAIGSLEIKTAWRDFGTNACPSSFYCDGRFGLVGLHLVQKTPTHGEWIWASFEHVANDPDCAPVGDSPIAPLSPLQTPWSFFDPATAGPQVMSTATCSPAAPSPQCNGDPRYSVGKHVTVFKPVNICRTSTLPPGGASPQNCAVPSDPTQSTANNPGNVACLNASLRPRLSGVWQNYKMIGSLWLKGKTKPDEEFWVGGFQNHPALQPPPKEPVGFPHLANTTMETWLQPGATGYDPKHNNSTRAGCFFCHNLPSAYTVANPSDHRSDDLSHFPGKLPPERLRRLLKSLVPAKSR